MQERLPPEVAQRCYFFNTFFFKKLTETSGGCPGTLFAGLQQGSAARQCGQALAPARPSLNVHLSHASAPTHPPACLPAGGSLTPELAAWAEQQGFQGAKLQALRNHQKVKKWTKVGEECRRGQCHRWHEVTHLALVLLSSLISALSFICLRLLPAWLPPGAGC